MDVVSPTPVFCSPERSQSWESAVWEFRRPSSAVWVFVASEYLQSSYWKLGTSLSLSARPRLPVAFTAVRVSFTGVIPFVYHYITFLLVCPGYFGQFISPLGFVVLVILGHWFSVSGHLLPPWSVSVQHCIYDSSYSGLQRTVLMITDDEGLLWTMIWCWHDNSYYYCRLWTTFTEFFNYTDVFWTMFRWFRRVLDDVVILVLLRWWWIVVLFPDWLLCRWWVSRLQPL